MEGYTEQRTAEPGEKANRRMSNVEPQNVEGWYRCALSFYKMHSMTQIPNLFSSFYW